MAKFVLIFSGLKLGVCLAKTQKDILGLVKHIFRFSCFKVQLSFTVVIAVKYIYLLDLIMQLWFYRNVIDFSEFLQEGKQFRLFNRDPSEI